MNAKAEKVALSLLAKHGQLRAPIDVEAVASHEGATILRDRLAPDVSGLLIRSAERTVIAVNGEHHLRRQRFTISHEIGHLTLHPGREYTLDSTVRLNWRKDLAGLATNKEEVEANAFAAALLMPKELVRDAIDRMPRYGRFGDEKIVTQLAQDFDVSREAMNFRLINLGIMS